jgi:hypothetical protein
VLRDSATATSEASSRISGELSGQLRDRHGGFAADAAARLIHAAKTQAQMVEETQAAAAAQQRGSAQLSTVRAEVDQLAATVGPGRYQRSSSSRCQRCGPRSAAPVR